MSKTYVVTWRVEIEAEDIDEARRKHFDALDAMDDAPCAVYIRGDGPVEKPAGLSAEEAAEIITANVKAMSEEP